MLKELVLKNRSYRRFDQAVAVEHGTLRELVDLARLSASGSNLQPLKFILSCEPEKNAKIFACLKWAAYLVDWPGPADGERPAAYLVVLGDKDISPTFGVNPGIAAQSILLGATEKGLGGCMIGNIRKQDLIQALDVLPRYDLLLVIALGKPKETVVIDPVGADSDIKYWRDAQGVHHVPKRSLDEIIIQ